MTPPIQEPTTQRSIAGQQWTTSQLARRPSPLNAALPFPWAILRDGAAVVPFNATNFPVNYQLATKNDPGDIYFSWTTTDSGDTGNYRFVLTLRQEGLYLIDAVINWDDTGTGDGTAQFFLNPSNSYNPFGVGDEKFDAQYGSDWQTTGASGDIQASSVQRISLIYSADAFCTLQPVVTLQLAAGNRGCSGIYLKAVYLEMHGDTNQWTVDEIPPSS